MTKVTSIGGEPQWAGEPMEDDEVADMVHCLEAILEEVKAKKIRGFTLAAVTDSASPHYIVEVKCKTGCSRLNLTGAAYLAAFETAEMMSRAGEVEEAT